jgi:hypothetical protein
MSEAGAYVRQIPPLLELVVIKGVSPIIFIPSLAFVFIISPMFTCG